MFNFAVSTGETTTPDLKTAEKQVEDAKQELVSWQSRAGDLRTELAHLEERSGADVLQSGDVAGTAAKIRAKRDELTVCESAIQAAQEAVRVAERECKRAEASAKRQQAGELRTRADDLDKKCEKHFAALRELQGTDYVPSCDARHVAANVRGGAPVVVTIPFSRAWRNQADALERQAAEIERQLQRTMR